MTDSFGRYIDYLRLSVTDRCNLRCLYCMPLQGVRPIPHADILSFEEILRVVRIMADLGLTKIKVTGGEALCRKNVTDLIRQLKQIRGIQCVTLTSNGVLLAENLESLIDAGLNSLNISVNTLNAETFSHMARAGGFAQIISVLEKIHRLPFPVKINCVPIRGLNDSEIAAIAGLAKNNAADVRFIELMPLGLAGNFPLLTQTETMAAIEKAYGTLIPYSGSKDASFRAGPSVYYSLEGFSGKIGFISPMSHNFCATCNRLRLNAAGLLMPCLCSSTGLDLAGLLRGSATDEELALAIEKLVQEKPKHHSFVNTEQNDKGMYKIGG